MKLIDYRALYECSTTMLLYNVGKEIAVLVAGVGLVKFKKKNKFTCCGKTIVGALLQENGMFIITDDSMFEMSEDNDDFNEFKENPLNMITLLENIRKELGLTKKNSKNELS